MHVKALSKNEILPAVKTPLFGAVRRIISSDAFASLLSGFAVMAVVLFAIFATLMLEDAYQICRLSPCLGLFSLH